MFRSYRTHTRFPADPTCDPPQVALRSIVGADNIDWSVLLSASVISLAPLVVVFLLFQRHIMNADFWLHTPDTIDFDFSLHDVQDQAGLD